MAAYLALKRALRSLKRAFLSRKIVNLPFAFSRATSRSPCKITFSLVTPPFSNDFTRYLEALYHGAKFVKSLLGSGMTGLEIISNFVHV